MGGRSYDQISKCEVFGINSILLAQCLLVSLEELGQAIVRLVPPSPTFVSHILTYKIVNSLFKQPKY